MEGCMDGWVHGWMSGRMHGWVGAWMDEWTDAWMGGCMDGCMDGWVHGWMWVHNNSLSYLGNLKQGRQSIYQSLWADSNLISCSINLIKGAVVWWLRA